MKRIDIALPRDLVNRLDRMAAGVGCSRAILIEEFIRAALEALPETKKGTE